MIYGSWLVQNLLQNKLNWTFINLRNRMGSFMAIEIERSRMIYGSSLYIINEMRISFLYWNLTFMTLRNTMKPFLIIELERNWNKHA